MAGKPRHGASGTPEYQVYATAKDRCTNPRSQRWETHGKRGIKFLFKSFEDFISTLGPRPSSEYSLDRYPDNDGDYVAGNVRWATRSQQQKNKRAYGKGYGWHKASGKWYARIHRDKEMWLGTFDTKKEAIQARENALKGEAWKKN